MEDQTRQTHRKARRKKGIKKKEKEKETGKKSENSERERRRKPDSKINSPMNKFLFWHFNRNATEERIMLLKAEFSFKLMRNLKNHAEIAKENQKWQEKTSSTAKLKRISPSFF
ncbi:hypothetical protein [Allobaculum sp. JKK-2023]|uniref:hypothetical protein n=1 Tax=Allobaculum sp. JKK-2023 TaxID=3108943 RepID=UPI002B05F367|nr:hypothetical protein [Allobaculum sp. JKK-2023]